MVKKRETKKQSERMKEVRKRGREEGAVRNQDEEGTIELATSGPGWCNMNRDWMQRIAKNVTRRGPGVGPEVLVRSHPDKELEQIGTRDTQ